MLFTRTRTVINFDYYVNGEMLQRTMGPVKDLGILFDSKLKFDSHINNIFIRLNKMLGFIIRNCIDFSDKHALKSIYCSLIRSICEYGSIIWPPYQISSKLKLEKIQHKFLRFLSYKCSIPREPHSSYSSLLAILNLETLECRRLRLDLYLAYKMFTGLLDCPDFLFLFSFNVPTRSLTRVTNTFYTNKVITNYAKNYPSNRIMQFTNELNIDFFVSSNFHLFKSYCNFIFNNNSLLYYICL